MVYLVRNRQQTFQFADHLIYCNHSALLCKKVTQSIYETSSKIQQVAGPWTRVCKPLLYIHQAYSLCVVKKLHNFKRSRTHIQKWHQIYSLELEVLTHTCNPSYSEGQGRRVCVVHQLENSKISFN